MRRGRQAPRAVQAHRAAVREAVPSCPPDAHTGLGVFPASLGELLGCLSVLQDPVVLGFELCPVGQQVPWGSR